MELIAYYHKLLLHSGLKRLLKTFQDVLPEVTRKAIFHLMTSICQSQINKLTNVKYGD